MLALTRAQNFSECMDPNYTPARADLADFKRKQHFFYAVLQKTVLYSSGKQIVRRYLHTGDAQSAMAELVEDANTSAFGQVDLAALHRKILNFRYDSSWKKSAVDFLVRFTEMAEEYNERQTNPAKLLTEATLQSALVNATRDQKFLADVYTHQMARELMGMPAMTYIQFYEALKTQATLHDSRRVVPTRDAHVHVRDDGDVSTEDGTNDGGQTPPQEWGDGQYEAFVTNTQNPAARIAQETYADLSPEARRIWRQLTESDRIAILRGGSEAKPAKPATARTVMLSDAQTISTVTPPSESKSDTPTTGLDANQTDATKTAAAHPGDPRRVLSTKPKKPKTTQANTVRFDATPHTSDSDVSSSRDDALHAAIHDYWSTRPLADSSSDDASEPDFPRGD